MGASAHTPPRWGQFLDVGPEQHAALKHGSYRLAACGAGWDVIVVAPLVLGLAALDVLGLVPGTGHGVVADRSRRELLVLVPPGTALPADGGVPEGVRLLSRGSWVALPCGLLGTWAASWVGGPVLGEVRHVDAGALMRAVSAADADRSAGACP
ncbi:hypothetical protein [Streptomyces jumonjinensis]|uniref:hypothetical protein n=1 Tax=Streptomyces jumonjinensis TaxID=1945 RepID=UPI0037B0E7AA